MPIRQTRLRNLLKISQVTQVFVESFSSSFHDSFVTMASIQVPTTHKALVYDSPGSVSTKIEEIETPRPGAGEVLVNLTHSGVCHSDMGVMW